jgi:hypothetical protein
MADRIESAADIAVSVDDATDITVEELSLTKEIDIETIYGSGKTLPDSYAINEISYQGSIELQGDRLSLEDSLFDENGIPEEFTVNIDHMDGEGTDFTQCLVTSEGYEMSAGDPTTTTFEFIAMGRKHTGGVEDQEP